jgi:hypothetical protein
VPRQGITAHQAYTPTGAGGLCGRRRDAVHHGGHLWLGGRGAVGPPSASPPAPPLSTSTATSTPTSAPPAAPTPAPPAAVAFSSAASSAGPAAPVGTRCGHGKRQWTDFTDGRVGIPEKLKSRVTGSW